MTETKTQNPQSLSFMLPGDVPLELMPIPAGEFLMGSPECELARNLDEVQHVVRISRCFWMGKYPVTQEQYRAVMGEESSHFHNGDTAPVDSVSGAEAEAFCKRLNELFAEQRPKGLRFGLPTEAQWEYSCRAGTNTSLNNGENLSGDESCEIMSTLGWYGKAAYGPQPVGQKLPNAWGLYDMLGNVLELCQDARDDYPQEMVVDPLFCNGKTRVLRGGCWRSKAYECRCATRTFSEQYEGCYGFRVALAAFPNPVKNKRHRPGYLPKVTTTERNTLLFSLPNNSSLEMMPITAGTFKMGYRESKALGRTLDSRKEVTISRDFWMARFPVTQAQWRAMQDYQSWQNIQPRFNLGDDYPLECISWKEAKVFCEVLNRLFNQQLPQGYRFDLPSEAQWEYACRAGTETDFGTGRNLTATRYACRSLDEAGWYYENSNGTTHPVGQKKPNAWGLCDMHGNVWEMCRDIYKPESDDNNVDPLGPIGDGEHVIRGGSWNNCALECCAMSRRSFDPDAREFNVGLRLALVPVDATYCHFFCEPRGELSCLKCGDPVPDAHFLCPDCLAEVASNCTDTKPLAQNSEQWAFFLDTRWDAMMAYVGDEDKLLWDCLEFGQRMSLFKALLKRGFGHPHMVSKTGVPLLLEAAQYAGKELVKFMIEVMGCGADQQVNPITRRTLLHVAVENDTTAYSLPSKKDKEAGNVNPNALVRYLVEERNMDVNAVDKDGDTPFLIAVCKLQYGMVQYLLDHGADANTEWQFGSALAEAIHRDAPDLAEMLSDHGANWTYIMPFKTKEKRNIPWKAYDDDVERDDELAGFSLIHFAAYRRSTDCIKLCLKHQLDPNQRSPKDGFTPLHALCASSISSFDAPEALATLVKAGADPTLEDNYGRTPLSLLDEIAKEKDDLEDEAYLNIRKLLKSYLNQ